MKKITFIITAIVFVHCQLLFSQEVCTSCANNEIDYSKNASALGIGNTSTGLSSLASGKDNTVNGNYASAFGRANRSNGLRSFAAGLRCYSLAGSSFALGQYNVAGATNAFVIGAGYSSNETEFLVNANPNSLMIGFRSTKPTFFVGESSGGSKKTGRIGIGGITEPKAKLHILADNDEDAAILLQPTGSEYHGKVHFGSTRHTISGRAKEPLTFSTDAAQGFFFKNGNIFQEDNYYFATSKIRSLDGGFLKLTNQNGSGINISPSGNVAIGTLSSGYKLAVNGNMIVTDGITTSTLEATNGVTTSTLEATNGITTSTLNATNITTSSLETTHLQVTDGVTNTNGMVLTSNENGLASWSDPALFADADWLTNSEGKIYHSNSNVGIGTNDPKAKLEVGGDFIVGNSHKKFIFHSGWSSNRLVIAPALSDGAGEWDKSLTLFENGNVGIGFTDPNYSTAKLTVKGYIRAREVKVRLNAGGADFVFDENFELPGLKETEEYISKHKHLNGIPSAKEMVENGIDLGDMQIKLLQKVEELTLYVIELKKENEEMKGEIEKLKED